MIEQCIGYLFALHEASPSLNTARCGQTPTLTMDWKRLPFNFHSSSLMKFVKLD